MRKTLSLALLQQEVLVNSEDNLART